MATLQEQLAQLSDEDLLALEQEIIKLNTPEGIQASTERLQAGGAQGGVTGGDIGRGLLAGAERGGRAVVSGVREMAGMTALEEEKPGAGDLEVFKEKERIKRRVAGEFEKEPKLSSIEEFREDLRKAKIGDIPWDDLKDKYPEPSKQKQIEEVRVSTLPQIERAPGFRMGTGGLISQVGSFLSPEQAEMDKTTLGVAEQITNIEDLQELVKREEEAEGKGIDVKAILEYFGMTREQVRLGQVPEKGGASRLLGK